MNERIMEWRLMPAITRKTGTLDNPIIVNSAGDEQFAGCTGYPADSHVTIWLNVSPQPGSYLTTCSPIPSCLRQISVTYPTNSHALLHTPSCPLAEPQRPNRCPASVRWNAARSAAASTAWNTSDRPTTRTPTTGTATRSPRRLRIM